jgi:hypothetical protein
MLRLQRDARTHKRMQNGPGHGYALYLIHKCYLSTFQHYNKMQGKLSSVSAWMFNVAISKWYEPHSLLRHLEDAGILQSLLQGLSGLAFDLSLTQLPSLPKQRFSLCFSQWKLTNCLKPLSDEEEK